jgi:hypothetical protein
LVAERVKLAGFDVVEGCRAPIGSADAASVVADRVVREALTGIALRRSG